MKRKRRNRRKTRKLQAQVRVSAVLASVLVPVFVTSFIWLMTGVRCEALGKKINMLEMQKEGLRKAHESEQDRWANLMAPTSFHQILRQHGLVMLRPDERQVVRISGSTGTSVATTSGRRNRAYYE
jgi:hypothetical protein